LENSHNGNDTAALTSGKEISAASRDDPGMEC